VFDANPSVKLIPEVLDYGGPFVMDFMQTGCFARWVHACERNYCMIGDLLLHPSGPPTDAMDGNDCRMFCLFFADLAAASSGGSGGGNL
jgi:hypothetical protein